MGDMFYNANVFNQPLNDWDVSSVTNMRLMFYNAYALKNQDLSSWNVGKVSNRNGFMNYTGGGNTEPNWK